jgi:hypothetical protein
VAVLLAATAVGSALALAQGMQEPAFGGIGMSNGGSWRGGLGRSLGNRLETPAAGTQLRQRAS